MSYIWRRKHRSDGIMFEYMQLLVCYILINIMSLETVLTITVNTYVNLVAVNDMCNKALLVFPLKNKIKKTLSRKQGQAGALPEHSELMFTNGSAPEGPECRAGISLHGSTRWVREVAQHTKEILEMFRETRAKHQFLFFYIFSLLVGFRIHSVS